MDPLADIDLNWLRALGHLLDARSVSGAAQRAGVGQPAMSRTLAHLRELFGDPLLVRSGRESHLTEHAEAIRPLVQEALLATRLALHAPSRFDPGKAVFALRIAASDYAQAAFLMPWLQRVRATAPGLELHMDSLTEQSVAQLAAGTLDFVLGPAVQRPELGLERFVVRPIWIDRYVVAMREGHACARGRFDLKRFFDQIHVRVQCGTTQASCEAAIERLGRPRRMAATLTTFLAALTLVRESDCLAVLPARFVSVHGAAFRMRELPFAAPGIGLFLVSHPRSSGNARRMWGSRSLLDYAAERRKVEG